jgi:hypothetical protein
MKLINAPATEYLLDASLESLHTESREWLSEIYFWSDEMSFFYKLINLREPHFPFPTADLAALEKELIQITTENLGKVKSEVRKHERALHAIVTNTSLVEERDYRDRHRSLLIEIHNTQSLIRKFKKNVYSFIK